jgi:hypothetical protein
LEKLCEYCRCTEYGITEVNTAPYDLCEGCRCEQAKENYYEEIGRDYNEDDENLGIPEEELMNNLERFRRGEIVLHTPTQELYDRLMQWCKAHNLTWGGDKATIRYGRWNEYGKETCVKNYGGSMMYGDKDWGDRTIVTLTNKDFEEEHQMTKDDLKVGQVVELRCGDTHLVYQGDEYPALYSINDSISIDNYNDDLTCKDCNYAGLDITKVYTTSNLVSVLSGNYDFLELIWSRENPEVTAMKANVAKMEAELESMKESLRKMEEM